MPDLYGIESRCHDCGRRTARRLGRDELKDYVTALERLRAGAICSACRSRRMVISTVWTPPARCVPRPDEQAIQEASAQRWIDYVNEQEAKRGKPDG